MTNSFVKRLLTLLYLLPKAKLLEKSLTWNKLAEFLKVGHHPPSSLKHKCPFVKHPEWGLLQATGLLGVTYNL